jgi:cytochrome b561
MTQALVPGRQDSRAALLGWITFLAFAVLFWNIISLPRTPLDQRAALRVFHDSLGLIVVLLALWQLFRMARQTALIPPVGLPEASFAFNRVVLAGLYLTFIATGLIGLIYGWGEFDREVVLFGLRLPAAIADSDATRKTFGYLHSALGFYYLFLLSLWILFGLYQHLRYRCGLLRLLPGARV